MKPATKRMFEMLEMLFCGQYEPNQFSCDFPKYCYENYDKLEMEYAGLGYYLDQEVPDICDEGEPGFDPINMIKKLKEVYEKAKSFLK